MELRDDTAWLRLQQEHRKKRKLFKCLDYEEARQFSFGDPDAFILVSIDCDLGEDPGSRRYYVRKAI